MQYNGSNQLSEDQNQNFSQGVAEAKRKGLDFVSVERTLSIALALMKAFGEGLTMHIKFAKSVDKIIIEKVF